MPRTTGPTRCYTDADSNTVRARCQSTAAVAKRVAVPLLTNRAAILARYRSLACRAMRTAAAAVPGDTETPAVPLLSSGPFAVKV